MAVDNRLRRGVRPTHAVPKPTPTPDGRPTFGDSQIPPTRAPGPVPTPRVIPGTPAPEPLDINLDEFLKGDMLFPSTPPPSPTPGVSAPRGALDSEGMNVAKAQYSPTPEEDDKMLEMMREFGPEPGEVEPEVTPTPSARGKLMEKLKPAPTPGVPSSTPPSWQQLQQQRPAPKSYDEQLMEELLGKKGY